MKAHSITLVLFVCLATPALSQTTFGVRGGLNVPYMRIIFDPSKIEFNGGGDPALSNPKQHASVTPGLRQSIGIFVQHNFTRKIALREDLLYQGQGCKNFSFEEPRGNGYQIKLNYLTLPVSFVWKAFPKISFSIGGYAAILIHTPSGFVKPKDYGQSPDYGFQAGAEYSFNRKIVAGLAYYYGLPNVGLVFTERVRSGQVYVAYAITKRSR